MSNKHRVANQFKHWVINWVKLRKTAVKPTRLLINLVIELKHVYILGRGPSSSLMKLCPQYLYQVSKSQYIIFWIIKFLKIEKQNLRGKCFVVCLYIIVLWSCCMCCFRTLFKVSSTKKVENGVVDWGIAIRITRFPVQALLGAQLVLGTQPHYITAGDLQVSESLLSRMTQSLPIDSQIAVKKTWFFVLNIFKGYCASAFKVNKCNHVAIRNSCAYNFFPFVKPGSKTGKLIASDGSYVTLYDLLSAGFFYWLTPTGLKPTNTQPFTQTGVCFLSARPSTI